MEATSPLNLPNCILNFSVENILTDVIDLPLRMIEGLTELEKSTFLGIVKAAKYL